MLSKHNLFFTFFSFFFMLQGILEKKEKKKRRGEKRRRREEYSWNTARILNTRVHAQNDKTERNLFVAGTVDISSRGAMFASIQCGKFWSKRRRYSQRWARHCISDRCC